MGAQWAEFDLEKAIWLIPAQRMKKRKSHVIPLPRQAVEVLRTSREAAFPRWLMEREWNQLSPGDGYVGLD
jgi:integrase